MLEKYGHKKVKIYIMCKKTDNIRIAKNEKLEKI